MLQEERMYHKNKRFHEYLESKKRENSNDCFRQSSQSIQSDMTSTFIRGKGVTRKAKGEPNSTVDMNTTRTRSPLRRSQSMNSLSAMPNDIQRLRLRRFQADLSCARLRLERELKIIPPTGMSST